MGEIRILDENVANIIAAGEVVESPASLIKELLENSIDAKSSKVYIEVSHGGREIKIKDNGKGMVKEDLLISIERHATSKIKEKDDIFNLKTYGFRGEALSSICAVSKVKISSRKNGEVGNTMTVLGSKVTSLKEWDGDVGTEIEVKELFFNTPARLKFLRKPSTEYGYIKDIVFQESLANPKIGITLVIDGKEILNTTGNGMDNAIVEIFGRNTLKNLITFKLGYLGNSNLSRSTRDSIYIFVNGRVVKSKIIEEAVIDGYYTKLTKGKFPFVIIFINIDGKQVDVNVHPAKKIVKFSNDTNIYSMVVNEIKNVIQWDDNLTSQDVKLEFQNIPVNNIEKEKKIIIENEKLNFQFRVESNESNGESSELKIEEKFELDSMDKVSTDKIAKKNDIFLTEEKISENKIRNLCSNKEKNNLELEREETENLTENVSEEKIEDIGEIKNRGEEKLVTVETSIEKGIDDFRKKPRKIIGQYLNSYIIVENEGNLEFYDQHIVHERILYEKYKNEYLNEKIQTQNLLIPSRISFERVDMDRILENMSLLESFGFKIEEFDRNEILVRGVPHYLFKDGIENLLRDILAEMKEYKNQDPRESIIITMSCKGAIKAGEPCSSDVLELLVNKLHEIGEYTCPHGRPIILKLNKSEIEKKFKRK